MAEHLYLYIIYNKTGRDLNIDIENGALMHKMLEINTLPGEYNKHIIEK